MNFEAPLTTLVWLTSIISIGADLSGLLLHDSRPGRRCHAVVEAIDDHLPAARWRARSFPELVKVFTSTESRHVREVVTSSQEGGASLGILSGLVAGNFRAYWLGMTMVLLMAIGYCFSTQGLGALMLAPRRFSRSAWWRSASWAWAR